MKLKFYHIIYFFFFSITANSQTRDSIYVDAAYTGAIETGSSTQPFKTIRKALDKRQANGLAGMVTDEVIIVRAGTYYPGPNDMVIVNRYNCGRNGKWLTIKSDVPFAATIRGDSLYKKTFAAIVTFTDSAQYVKLQSFTIAGLRNNPDSTKWKNTDGTYTATRPTVISMYNGQPVRTPYGDTIYECKKDVKFGIQVASNCRYVSVLNSDISDISWTSNVDPFKADSLLTEAEKKILRNAWPNDNAGPVNVLGSAATVMTNITIDGSEVHHCIPGWTEAITMNGYLDTFKITNNLVHDIKNIGIVAAGNYRWVLDPANGFSTPASQNYARNGTITDNTVYNCLSPIAASAGIYLDGARTVLVERNRLYDNHVGVSVGNETSNSHSGGHTIRNNIIYDNVWTGMILGSNADSAWVENTKVLNNTLFRNNTSVKTLIPKKDANGFVIIQGGVAVIDTFPNASEITTQRLSNSNDLPGAKIVVQNNIFRSRKGKPIIALQPFKTNQYTGAALINTNINTLLDWNYNLYYIEPGYNNAINYDFAAAGFTGNTYNTVNYKATVGLDSNSIGIELATAPSPDPVFVGGTVFPDRFKLVSGSTAYNIGNPAASYSVSGLVDYIFNDRIMGCHIDAGALEFVTTCTAGPVVTALNALRITTVLGKDTYSLYPNPTTGDVSIRAVRSTGGMVLIRVRDMLGRLVMEKRSPLAEGINTIRIDNLKQAGLRKGIYLVDISDKTGRVGIYKLVVQ